MPIAWPWTPCEPIVRKAPEQWLGAVEPWLADESKWLRRGRRYCHRPVAHGAC